MYRFQENSSVHTEDGLCSWFEERAQVALCRAVDVDVFRSVTIAI